MKSIYGRLIFGFMLAIVLSFSLSGYIAIRQNVNHLTRKTIDELDAAGEHIADLINKLDEETARELIEDYASAMNIAVDYTIDHHKIMIGDINESLIVNAKNKALAYNDAYYTSNGYIFSYQKIISVKGREIVLTLQNDVTTDSNQFISTYFFSAVIMFFAGSVIFLVLAELIVRPISNLTKATNELSKGNYKVRVHYNGNDEFSKLNRAFNQMAVQLAKQDETRQQFISDVSHEFQTPLTAISGFATILKNETLTDEQRRKYCDIILFQSKRLSTLSKNMLQLTLLEGEEVVLEKQDFSLIDQLNRIIETQDNAALAKDIEIELNRPRGDIIIHADQARMEQVWINLISNAIKYTNEHGVVTVTIKKTMNEIEVSIEDTGVGMSKADIAHIFERFYRIDKSRAVEGNGLGLSIVKRILDLHNYRIDVKSQEDVGSVFTVFIPVERASINDLAKNLHERRIRKATEK